MGSDFQNMLERILPPKAINGRVFKPKVTTSDGIRQDFNAPRNGRNHGGIIAPGGRTLPHTSHGKEK